MSEAAERLAEIEKAHERLCSKSGDLCDALWLIRRVKELEEDREIEIRRNEDDTLDEVVTRGFHLEQMSDNHWWLMVSNSRREVHVDLSARTKIVAAVREE